MWFLRQMIYLFQVLLKYIFIKAFFLPRSPDSFPSVFNMLREVSDFRGLNLLKYNEI